MDKEALPSNLSCVSSVSLQLLDMPSFPYLKSWLSKTMHRQQRAAQRNVFLKEVDSFTCLTSYARRTYFKSGETECLEALKVT